MSKIEITDEMLKVAGSAHGEATTPPNRDFADGMRAALEAVTPLIAEQVRAECAKREHELEDALIEHAERIRELEAELAKRKFTDADYERAHSAYSAAAQDLYLQKASAAEAHAAGVRAALDAVTPPAQVEVTLELAEQLRDAVKKRVYNGLESESEYKAAWLDALREVLGVKQKPARVEVTLDQAQAVAIAYCMRFGKDKPNYGYSAYDMLESIREVLGGGHG